MSENRLILLAGPSGVGKTPLEKALNRHFPGICKQIEKIVLYNSRKPRPGEREGIDYFFRSENYLNQLRHSKQYIVADVRGDVQALDLAMLNQSLEQHSMIFEGNTLIALKLLDRFRAEPHTKILSIFLSPLNREEIDNILTNQSASEFEDHLKKLMYNKLERRLYRSGKRLTRHRKDNLILRAGEAFAELRQAWRFDWILPNHDGEDSDHWETMLHPVGDARKSMLAFSGILKNGHSDLAEKWKENFPV